MKKTANGDYPLLTGTGDSYQSEKKNKSYFLINPMAAFLPKLIKLVIRSGRLAKKGKYGNIEWVKSSLEFLKALESTGVSFDISGVENIKNFDGPAVFISNHMSTLETVVLPCIVQPFKEVTFVVKQELLKYPYFGHVLNSRSPIVVGRSNPREDLVHVINTGDQYLKAGRSIIIFPQRTRSKNFNPESFNSLGIKLAKKSGVHVVPVALVTDAWGNGKFIKELGKLDINKKVHIAFGRPFKVETSGSKEHLAVLDFIRDKLIEWNREDCLTDK